MISRLQLDFLQITDMADFYRQFATLMALEPGFGCNLDALYDVLTGEVALPLHLTLCHLQQHTYPQQFDALVRLLEGVQRETAGDFRLFIQ